MIEKKDKDSSDLDDVAEAADPPQDEDYGKKLESMKSSGGEEFTGAGDDFELREDNYKEKKKAGDKIAAENSKTADPSKKPRGKSKEDVKTSTQDKTSSSRSKDKR